jgi:hypothetical protein
VESACLPGPNASTVGGDPLLKKTALSSLSTVRRAEVGMLPSGCLYTMRCFIASGLATMSSRTPLLTKSIRPMPNILSEEHATKVAVTSTRSSE